MFSSAPFRAVDNNQRKGNIDNSETAINDACIKNPLEQVLKFLIFLPFLYNLYCLFSNNVKFKTDITSTITRSITEAAEAIPKSRFSNARS